MRSSTAQSNCDALVQNQILLVVAVSAELPRASAVRSRSRLGRNAVLLLLLTTEPLLVLDELLDHGLDGFLLVLGRVCERVGEERRDGFIGIGCAAAGALTRLVGLDARTPETLDRHVGVVGRVDAFHAPRAHADGRDVAVARLHALDRPVLVAHKVPAEVAPLLLREQPQALCAADALRVLGGKRAAVRELLDAEAAPAHDLRELAHALGERHEPRLGHGLGRVPGVRVATAGAAERRKIANGAGLSRFNAAG